MRNRLLQSRYIIVLCSLIIIATHLYYPKWQKGGTEATISWDVSGYYLYLPALFIYNDLKNLAFYPELLDAYGPTPDFQQAFKHEDSGHYVMKYAMGLSVQFAPFFIIGHIWALASEYPPDGYSLPYQFMMSLGSIIVAILGLILMQRNLRHYFDEAAVSLGLLAMVLGSNYLNYTAIDGAQTHNFLFTIYAALIAVTIAYYRAPSFIKAAVIGALVGLAALTRPTEFIGMIIPILWGLAPNREALMERLEFFKSHVPQLMTAAFCGAAVGSLQLIYWKYASGDWLVYSYQDQGFSWFRPHIWKGIMSYKSGWLVYSPMMIFTLIGFYFLWTRNRSLALCVSLFSVMFVYIAFAWDIWWYGGSLGQRTMVQLYPILLFPMVSFFDRMPELKTWLRGLVIALVVLFVYLNLWFTHQAHHGGWLKVSQMTGPYYWHTLGRMSIDSSALKLLDGDEIYNGERDNVLTVFEWQKGIELPENEDSLFALQSELPPGFEWIRVTGEFAAQGMQWNHWHMTQMIITLYEDSDKVNENMFRIHRYLNLDREKEIYLDVSNPEGKANSFDVRFYNPGNKVDVKQIRVEVFNEAKS